MEYERQARFAGESKYPLKKMIAFAFEGITSFSVKPLRFALILGGAAFVVSIAILIYGLIRWALGLTVTGWTSLLFSIWALGGLQLLMLGIVGEYVGKTYLETKRRPRYIVSETLLRLLEACHAVNPRDMEAQILDNMDLERERGITIKARAVSLEYTDGDGESYRLNLIDTPGHVDFNYEVSRSLAACEGALLVVDARQGIEAQTLGNAYLALDNDLEILPVLNKIDLPGADPGKVKADIEDVIGIPAMDAPEISAKLGLNIEAVFREIIDGVPAPKGDPEAPLKALVFDSQYDPFVGVIVYMRLMDGCIRPGMDVRLMASGAEYRVVEVGHMGALSLQPCSELRAGDVGYFTASIKNVADTQPGERCPGAPWRWERR